MENTILSFGRWTQTITYCVLVTYECQRQHTTGSYHLLHPMYIVNKLITCQFQQVSNRLGLLNDKKSLSSRLCYGAERIATLGYHQHSNASIGQADELNGIQIR